MLRRSGEYSRCRPRNISSHLLSIATRPSSSSCPGGAGSAQRRKLSWSGRELRLKHSRRASLHRARTIDA